MKLLKNLIAAASVALVAALPTASHATLVMTLDDLSTAGVDRVIYGVDGPGFDWATFPGSVGTWALTVTTGYGNGNSDIFGIDLNSIAASSSAGGTLRITLTETDLSLGANGAPVTVNSAIGGTTQGTVSYKSWLDDANSALNLTNPTGQGTLLFSGSSSTMVFAASGQGTTRASDPFAMTLQVDITHTGRATSSFDFAATVPEPGTLALLSVALLGAGFAARRRNA
jgi:PEP-CTERM motif